MTQRTFIVKKFVRAKSAADAIKKSAKVPIGEVYEAEDHPRAYGQVTNAIGYQLDSIEDDDSGN